MMDWRPIDDGARDGNVHVFWAIQWGCWAVLRWKTNHRIGKTYFGHPEEYDDYDMVDDQPSHYLPIILPGEVAP